jgi:uncharacterized protein YjbJ (UPF0337 family)
MDWRVQGSSKQVRGKIKEQSGKLTDDDSDFIAGLREQHEGTSRSAMATRRTRCTASRYLVSPAALVMESHLENTP